MNASLRPWTLHLAYLWVGVLRLEVLRLLPLVYVVTWYIIREFWVTLAKAVAATLDTNIASLFCNVPCKDGQVLAFSAVKTRCLEPRGDHVRLACPCSVAWPEEGKGATAALEIWLRLLWPGLHRNEAPSTTLAQWDAVRDTDLQGSSLPATGRAAGQSGRTLYAYIPE